MKADEWNEKYEPGMEVIVILDDGSEWRAKTRSHAWQISNEQSLVAVIGKEGGYSLDRVRPVG